MRHVRPTLIAFLTAAVWLSPAPRALSAPAGPVPDTTGIFTPWKIVPAFPCVRDSVTMVVRGYVATACDSFMGAEAIGPLHVRIRVQHNVDLYCFAAPSQFYPVPVPLGMFPAGTLSGLVDLVTTEVHGDGTTTIATRQFRFEFAVSAECGPQPPPGDSLPFVSRIGTDPDQPCFTQPASLIVSGLFRDGCGQVIDSRVDDPGHVTFTLKPYVLPDSACTGMVTPWHVTFPLGTLPAGLHRTEITEVLLVPDSTGTTFLREFHYKTHEFWVFGDCDSGPIPPGRLPYVTQILINKGTSCEPGPICPEDSIRVSIGGIFPTLCFEVRRVELIPSPVEIVPLPPPTVRVIVDDHACDPGFCNHLGLPWAVDVMLPPWPAGKYPLTVQLAQVTCSDTYPPGDLYSTEVPLFVADSCPPPPVCLTASWGPWALPSVHDCNATISTARPAQIPFAVAPSVPLAGLQGTLRLPSAQLGITAIEAIGPAAGMLVDWAPTVDGVKFVLVARSGAPIPIWPPPGGTNDHQPRGWPVLNITVSVVGRGLIPDRTPLDALELLGSDIDGHAVRFCPPPPCASVDPRLSPPRAWICAEQGCDFNADGASDIRDLVLMVHCMNAEGPCPPDANTRFDCDGDSLLAIPDVLCCAREILGQPGCAGCVPDSIRPEPGVSLEFKPPEVTSDGITLPLTFAAYDRVGAAKLTLELPLDRYQVIGFEGNGSWLALHEEREGRLTLGMISIRNSRAMMMEGPPTFRLQLGLKPGARPGGMVTATAGEFSGPDGVTLRVDLGRPSEPLPGSGEIALSASQPNPFSRETAFTLDLPQAGDVTVRIYDLRGRTIATLHQAPLAAGPHEFRWDGTQSDGTAAPNGVYFYRATVSGHPLSRKLILMRGN